MASESTDVKPAAQPITLRVREADGTETMFKVKRTTRFDKVYAAFFSKKGVTPNSYKFMNEGELVAADTTPEEMDMEDNTVLDAVIIQTGGC